MNAEQKKQLLIEARNRMTLVFNDSKENWGDGWWCSNLSRVMGNLDSVINTLGTDKPKLVGEK